LERCEGKINLVARSSGVDVKTLYRKMRQHGLDKRSFKRHDGSEGTSAGKAMQTTGQAWADDRSG
jgi:hypothetical protein